MMNLEVTRFSLCKYTYVSSYMIYVVLHKIKHVDFLIWQKDYIVK